MTEKRNKYQRTKFLLILFILATIYPPVAYGQWVRQRNGYNEQKGFVGIAAADDLHGYAAGVINQGGQDIPVVFYTSDGGNNWSMARPDNRMISMYFSAFAPSPLKCYIGGVGKVFITEDGGVTWRESQISAFTPLKAILVGGYGDSFVVAVAGASICSSNDSALSWTCTTNPLEDSVSFNDIVFIDTTHGWISSGNTIKNDHEELIGYEKGALLATTDGGANWIALRSNEERQILSPCFINPDEGWVVTNSMSGPTLEKTNDGGRTWQQMSLPQLGGEVVSSLTYVHFFDRCEGFLIGQMETGMNKTALFYTRDGGQTWVEQDTKWTKVEFPPEIVLPFDVYATLLKADFYGRDVGWVVGTYEFIGRYDANQPPTDCGGQMNPETGQWEKSEDGFSMDAYGEEGEKTSGGEGGCGCDIVK